MYMVTIAVLGPLEPDGAANNTHLGHPRVLERPVDLYLCRVSQYYLERSL